MKPEACHAPLSKRVEHSEKHESPRVLAQKLVRRWDRDTALVLADWLEEVGFPGYAQQLRRKSFEQYSMRNAVNAIAFGMGLTTPYLSGNTRWKLTAREERAKK